ncbi:MAG: ABC transporter substrate-binding protein [Desulfocapsaceae bacterium]
MSRLYTQFIICVICVFLLSSCETGIEPKSTPISVKLGVVGPFSGTNKRWGESGFQGVQTAVEYHKVRNRGLQVEIIKEDDQSDPAKADLAFAKLAIQDQVDAVIVLSGSRTTLGIAKSADRYKIPIISTLSSLPEVTKNDWVSQIIFDDRAQGTVAALFVMDELLIERASVIWDGDDPHSKVLAENFKRTYQEAGGSIVSIDISARQDDYLKILDQLQKNNVEFVYLPMEGRHVANFEQSVREMRFNPQSMVSDGVLSQLMLEYADNPNLLEGMLATDIYANEVPVSDFGKAVSLKFKKLFNTPATTITALGCEGTHVALTAIEKCGKNPQNECINRMIRSGNEFEGILDPFFIGLDGNAQRPVYINKIRNKRLRFLLKVN